ncbi:MAG: T9SS type A sorting domain-containing protein [Ignavibacteriae bacterium]|nr:T9SS C-terminal target domain-containing protein [Ignavibacteriota bacterium]NOH00110.1 T9SS type A sorting domain-containing protein [Ignavibacteriota bacterium]
MLITVYDILGNEITLLVNEQKPSGTYEVVWDAGNQPSGIYFYKIETDYFYRL